MNIQKEWVNLRSAFEAVVKLLELNMLESIIFSRIKGNFSSKIKEKYKSIQFTTQEQSKATPKFPNVYVYLMPGTETGLTLERTVFEEGLFTFQIRVTNNSGQTAVQEITNELIRLMKRMSFEIVGTPVYENDSDTQWSVSRYRRTIGRNDVL